MNILLTGYTGNLGPEIARRLRGHDVFALVREGNTIAETDGVIPVTGSLHELPASLAPTIEIIVHGAACTAFRIPLEEARRVNVEGTARLLEFARECGRLRQFVHLSTVCVCGARSGSIPETPLAEPAHFFNSYEQSKWEAETLVLASGLPAEIARLSIVAGSEIDGAVRRPGALHRTLHWLTRGLIPMIPATGDARMDLISTEFAGAGIAELIGRNASPGRISHIAAGEKAERLGDLLDHVAEDLRRRFRTWRSGSLVMPDLVDATTFALFEATVQASGDALFQRVCEDAQSFMPGLLHPRIIQVSEAAPAPPIDGRGLLSRVLSWLLAHEWGRPAVATHSTPSHVSL